MLPRFQVVIPAYNCAAWIGQSLDSVAEQHYSNYRVCVVDDASTDPTMRSIIRQRCEERGWLYRFEPVNRGSLHSIVVGIESLAPDDQDVIITVDGDDWLAGKEVFSYIASVYQQGEVDLTYGHFRYHPSGKEGAGISYQPGRLRTEQGPILPAPLRTFRAFLWKAIAEQDLQDGQGNYLRYATDWAFMLPMMEMAGRRQCQLDRVLYIYNYDNEINEWKLALTEQRLVQLYILSKPAYDVHINCRQIPAKI